MNPPLRLIAMLLCLLVAGRAQVIEAGAKLPSLQVGATTYQQVQVRSINARTVMITHSGGMASVRLRDLAPEWQARFGYDPALEAAADLAAREAPKPAAPAPRPAPKKVVSKFETLLRQFGEAAAIQPEVDLRQKYLKLELGVKSQGRRPSCAIFAVVSALEFQNAELAGKAEKFSEEYLIWAVRQSLRRLPAEDAAAGDIEDQDAGFTLAEVVAALRAYGIPLQASMPNTFGSKMAAIESPPAAIVDEARSHQRVFVHTVPGRGPVSLLNNAVHALNAGVPVPVGMAWPHYRSLRTGYLSGQTPLAGVGHAVTLVGYKSPTGKLEDAVFLFKNSWGADWGQGGYGTATYGYLSKHLQSAILLEVQRN